LIFPKDVYNNLPTKPSEEELDMLDLAFEPTETYVAKAYLDYSLAV